MSERLRRRVGPWERRRLAGIFSAFQALFFEAFFLARKLVWTRRAHPKTRPDEASPPKTRLDEEAGAKKISYSRCL